MLLPIFQPWRAPARNAFAFLLAMAVLCWCGFGSVSSCAAADDEPAALGQFRLGVGPAQFLSPTRSETGTGAGLAASFAVQPAELRTVPLWVEASYAQLPTGEGGFLGLGGASSRAVSILRLGVGLEAAPGFASLWRLQARAGAGLGFQAAWTPVLEAPLTAASGAPAPYPIGFEPAGPSTNVHDLDLTTAYGRVSLGAALAVGRALDVAVDATLLRTTGPTPVTLGALMLSWTWSGGR